MAKNLTRKFESTLITATIYCEENGTAVEKHITEHTSEKIKTEDMAKKYLRKNHREWGGCLIIINNLEIQSVNIDLPTVDYITLGKLRLSDENAYTEWMRRAVELLEEAERREN